MLRSADRFPMELAHPVTVATTYLLVCRDGPLTHISVIVQKLASTSLIGIFFFYTCIYCTVVMIVVNQ